ncbi:MAG: M20/M25/M40 family metallo-hydrolase [Christensenella sp.]|nr:M20/M25/M40 family metallo-hydrolase [Christensenella sp.]
MFVTEAERQMVQEIKASNAVDRIRDIIALAGDRFVGSEGDKKSINYVKGYFASLGLDVKETQIEVPGFEDHGAEITLLADGTKIGAIPAYFSLPTPETGLDAELVYAGGGREEDYEGKDVSGKIVVLREENAGYALFWLGTFAKRAFDKGAVGIIAIHPMAWPYRMSMEAGNSSIENRFLKERLPAVCISAIDGLTIMKAIGAGQAMVRLTSNVRLTTAKSCVVSGFHYGTGIPEERIGIIGHRDNGYAPGANDNLSGTGTMMELARVMKEHKFKRTIEFMASTAEEGVTQGIYEYICQHKEDLQKNMVAFFDLDMFGGGGKLKLVDEGCWPDAPVQKHDEQLMQMVEKIAEELGYEVDRMTATWGVAESGRFLEIGVPAIWFWRPDDQYYHSVHDTVENLDGNALKVVGDLTCVAAIKVLNR